MRSRRLRFSTIHPKSDPLRGRPYPCPCRPLGIVPVDPVTMTIAPFPFPHASLSKVGVRLEIVGIDALAHQLNLADESVEPILHCAKRLQYEVVTLRQFVPL
jgi:hypothetical protein